MTTEDTFLFILRQIFFCCCVLFTLCATVSFPQTKPQMCFCGAGKKQYIKEQGGILMASFGFWMTGPSFQEQNCCITGWRFGEDTGVALSPDSLWISQWGGGGGDSADFSLLVKSDKLIGIWVIPPTFSKVIFFPFLTNPWNSLSTSPG